MIINLIGEEEMVTEEAEAAMTYRSIHRKVPLTGRGELVMIHSSSGYWVPPMGHTIVAPGSTTRNCADKVLFSWRMLFRRGDR